VRHADPPSGLPMMCLFSASAQMVWLAFRSKRF
jgi:hypothetical protein